MRGHWHPLTAGYSPRADRLWREGEDGRIEQWVGDNPDEFYEDVPPVCVRGHEGKMYRATAMRNVGAFTWRCRQCQRDDSREFDRTHREYRRAAKTARDRARGVLPAGSLEHRALISSVRTLYSEEQVARAAALIAKGSTLEAAAVEVGIPRSTLGYRLRKRAA